MRAGGSGGVPCRIEGELARRGDANACRDEGGGGCGPGGWGGGEKGGEEGWQCP